MSTGSEAAARWALFLLVRKYLAPLWKEASQYLQDAACWRVWTWKINMMPAMFHSVIQHRPADQLNCIQTTDPNSKLPWFSVLFKLPGIPMFDTTAGSVSTFLSHKINMIAGFTFSFFCFSMWRCQTLSERQVGGTRELYWVASTAADYFYWLTNFLCRRKGCPGSDVEAYNGWHAGHIFASSLTVLHEDVDLTGFKPNSGIYPDNAPWPVRSRKTSRKNKWMNGWLQLFWQQRFSTGWNTNQRRTAAPREPTARSTEPSSFISIVPWILRPKYCRPGAKSAAAILWDTQRGKGLSEWRP